MIIVLAITPEVSHNASRDRLGQKIPESEYSAIIAKTDYSKGNYEFSKDYRIYYRLSDGSKGESGITKYDYNYISVGDTLTRESARSFCEKNLGDTCLKSLIEITKISLVILAVMGIPILSYWLIKKYFGAWLSISYIGKTWDKLKNFFIQTLEKNYSWWAYLTIVIISNVLATIVIWLAIRNNKLINTPLINALKVTGMYYGTGLFFILIIGGTSNYKKNFFIMTYGIIGISLIIILFGFLFGVPSENMVKSVLSK